MTTATLPASRSKTIILWILRILMATLFLLASLMKLTGRPDMVAEFDTIGVGQWFRYLTGLLEVVGGIGILVPSVSVFATTLLLVIDAGAFVAQVTILHMDWIHTIVIGAVLGTLIYLQRHQLSKLQIQ
jgi:putative oxidoreductase